MLFIAVGAKCQAPPTSREYFAKKGIPYTTPGLRSALRNGDPEVRSTAASELSQDGDLASIPLLENLLRTEKDDRVRTAFQAALASLDVQKGFPALQATCDDDKKPWWIRMSAAEKLQNLGQNTCLISVVRILDQASSDASVDAGTRTAVRYQGLLYLRKTPAAADSILPTLRKVAELALGDQLPPIRKYAGQVLFLYGDQNSLTAMASAISREQDVDTRRSLDENYKRLDEGLKFRRK